MMTSDEIEKDKMNHIFDLLSSKEELRDWLYVYFDIKFPMGTVHPSSSHGPVDAMWRIYELLKTGESQEVSQVAMLASRDSGKTLSAAAIEVLAMVHFRIPVAHMAAIRSQSEKSIQYVNSFFRKISKYLEAHKWKKNSDSKSMIEWITDDGTNIYLKIVVATVAGANSEHVPLLCVHGSTQIDCENTILTAEEVYNTVSSGKEVSVLTHNGKLNRIESKKVLKVFKSFKTSFEIEFSGGKSVICSEDHPFLKYIDKFTPSQYVPLKELRLGDCCYFRHGNGIELCKVTSLRELSEDVLYDFTVEDNHNFFANGILVHNCIDEIDTVRDPKALEEAKMIPTVYKGFFPLTVYLSTRKYAGGLMEKTVKQVEKADGEILRWNIIDVTERISNKIALVDQPKVKRFISRDLPMVNLSPAEWERLTDDQKNKFEEFWSYAGIAEDKMLPVIKNYLVDRPRGDKGGLFKPLVAVRNNFKALSDEMAMAQLLCEKPSSIGLVYPRFDPILNSISVAEAYHKISGKKNEAMTFDMLVNFMVHLGVQFYGGADWGFTDYTSLVVLAVLPNSEVWLIDTISESNLELEDIVKYALQLQGQYPISKWYCDSAYPAYLKTFNKNGLKSPTIVKDVAAGIAAVQRKIVNSMNHRTFKVLRTDNNEKVLEAFSIYKWKLDGKGDPTDKPEHGSDGTSDIMDSIRYPFQILFSEKNKVTFDVATGENSIKTTGDVNKDIMLNKINELSEGAVAAKSAPAKKKIFWA